MKMTKKERELLMEIREHTIDCDWNRVEHFYLYNRYIKIVRYFHITEAMLLFSLLLYYIISSTWPGINSIGWLKIVPLGLSIAALCVQMIDYYTNYGERADQHWTAAQAYSRLYRECQFFPVHYANTSVVELTRILHDICNELHDLGTLSPNVENKAYLKASIELKDKKYPVDRLLNEIDDEILKSVISEIVTGFKDYAIEIYVYGSYVNKIIYNDIDLAIIIYDVIDYDIAERKAVEIESMFRTIPLDITVMTERDIEDNEQILLVRNVQMGNCLYKSPEIKESLQQRLLAKPSYKEIVEKYLDRINGNPNDPEVFLENAYCCFYYMIASILESEGITWDGESSLLSEFKKISDREDRENLLTNFILLRHMKNKEGSNPVITEETQKTIMSEILLFLN